MDPNKIYVYAGWEDNTKIGTIFLTKKDRPRKESGPVCTFSDYSSYPDLRNRQTSVGLLRRYPGLSEGARRPMPGWPA